DAGGEGAAAREDLLAGLEARFAVRDVAAGHPRRPILADVVVADVDELREQRILYQVTRRALRAGEGERSDEGGQGGQGEADGERPARAPRGRGWVASDDRASLARRPCLPNRAIIRTPLRLSKQATSHGSPFLQDLYPQTFVRRSAFVDRSS